MGTLIGGDTLTLMIIWVLFPDFSLIIAIALLISFCYTHDATETNDKDKEKIPPSVKQTRVAYDFQLHNRRKQNFY